MTHRELTEKRVALIDTMIDLARSSSPSEWRVMEAELAEIERQLAECEQYPVFAEEM